MNIERHVIPDDLAKIWPRIVIPSAHAPGGIFARRLADGVKEIYSQSEEMVSNLADDLGCSLKFAELSAAKGGLQAGLVPDFGNRFDIICDPWIGDLSPRLIDFRIAHEIAHTLFYERTGDLPTHDRSLFAHGPMEERFCDNFAAFLLSQ